MIYVNTSAHIKGMETPMLRANYHVNVNFDIEQGDKWQLKHNKSNTKYKDS